MKKQLWSQRLSLLILTSMLGACASFGPSHDAARMLSAQTLALPEGSSYHPQNSWWLGLADPTLNQLIERGLANAPSMKLAADRMNEANSAISLSQSTLGPQVNLNAVKDRQLYSEHGLFPPPIGGNYIDAYTLSLNAAWEIDFWGKNRAQIRAAVGQARAIAFERQQAALTLTQAIITQYTQLQRLQQQQHIIQARIKLAQTRLGLLKARVNAGLLSADQLHVVEQGQAQLAAQQAALQGEQARTLHALAALTGQAPDALNSLKAAKLGPVPTLPYPALQADLLGQRPDIASQREQVGAMAENIKVARADFYPNVSLSALVGLNALQYSKLFNSSSKIVDFQPAISLPIFHSGQLRANLRREQARYDQAVDQYNQTVLNALKDAADALSGEDQARAQLKDARTRAHASQQSAEAMLLRMKAGIAGKLDTLESQDNQLAQVGAQLDAQANAQIAWAVLNTALGGGISQPSAR